jgi:hypothetical protein
MVRVPDHSHPWRRAHIDQIDKHLPQASCIAAHRAQAISQRGRSSTLFIFSVKFTTEHGLHIALTSQVSASSLILAKLSNPSTFAMQSMPPDGLQIIIYGADRFFQKQVELWRS